MWVLEGGLSQAIPYAALQRPHPEMAEIGGAALPPGAALLLNYMERRAPRRARWPDPTFPPIGMQGRHARSSLFYYTGFNIKAFT